jgi:propanol-preferring alcohol dehydrogenase
MWCGTALTNLKAGRTGGTLPRIIGHEIGGVVEEIGSLVTTFKPGDRVAVSFYITCGYCRWCVEGRETLCENFGGQVGKDIDGGYAEYTKIPQRNVIQIPDGVGFAEAGVATDAVATNWHVFKERAKTKPNDTILVSGAGGGVGIHAVQVAKIFGAHVIGADISDDKLQKVKEYGADEVIHVKGKDLAQEVRRVTGGKGVDTAVDMVSSKETIEGCIKSLGRGGRLVVVGIPNDITSLDFNPRHLITDEIVVTGCRCATKQEIRESLELVRRGLVKTAVLQTFRLEEANRVHELIDHMKLPGRSAFIFD